MGDDDIWGVKEAPRVPLNIPTISSSTSTSSEEAQEQNDEVTTNAAQRPHPPNNDDADKTEAAPKTHLPSPDEAFNEVKAAPKFLDPEALRQTVEITREPENRASKQQQDSEPSTKKKEWDISKMAPRLPSTDEEQLQETGTISGRAVKYNKKAAVEAMPVEELLAKGGALPRKRQATKDKEQNKRAKGQSHQTHWKSEAEMALRQSYD